MWQVYVLLGILTIVVAMLWILKINYSHKNNPDFEIKQDDFYHDLKDWDVTIADGLKELEKNEREKKNTSKKRKNIN